MKKNSTILIVDDIKENLDVLLQLLQGYDIIPALDGPTALEIVQNEEIDLILLDIMMPLMNGFEVCKHLKSNPKMATIPIIFLSARSQIEDIQKGFELGAVDYIAKPFEPKELLVRVKNHLKLRSYERELQERVDEAVAKNLLNEQLMFQNAKQAALGELLMHISHQWKQPLAELSSMTILMYSNLELDKKIEKQKQFETIKRMEEIIQFMAKTVATFSNFYRPSHNIQEFSLHHAIEQTLSVLDATLDFEKIKITLEAKENCIYKGNENEFSQIIFSIINNARDIFENRKILNPKIEITIHANRLTIEDNGGGIASEILDTLFLPYVTTKPKGGLGLYLSHAIALKNSWKLSATNCNNGALFSLDLRHD
jgi:CheY-like chemotaxis protein